MARWPFLGGHLAILAVTRTLLCVALCCFPGQSGVLPRHALWASRRIGPRPLPLVLRVPREVDMFLAFPPKRPLAVGEEREGTVHPEYLGFGKLFEMIRDGIIVADAKTQRIVLWNSAATAIFGYSPEEALRLRVEDLDECCEDFMPTEPLSGPGVCPAAG